MEIDETVEMVEGVLVNMVGGHSGDIKGVTTLVELVEVGTCNEDGGEGTVGGRDREDAETDSDTIAVGIRERESCVTKRRNM